MDAASTPTIPASPSSWSGRQYWIGDLSGDLAAKIRHALTMYELRSHQAPTVLILSPDLSPNPSDLPQGITLRKYRSLPTKTLWVGLLNASTPGDPYPPNP